MGADRGGGLRPTLRVYANVGNRGNLDVEQKRWHVGTAYIAFYLSE
jgi:hypothetical protein